MSQNHSSNGHSNGHHPAKSKPCPAKSKNPPKWTIMIYLAGDGNLTAHCITVLQQLEAVAHSPDVRVLACFDSNTPTPKGSRYLEINGQRSAKPGHFWTLYDGLERGNRDVRNIRAPDFCESNGGKYYAIPKRSRPVAAEGVKRFIKWAVKRSKSERYMLIFMGHGPIVASQTFLAKENPPSFLKLKDLKDILGKHFGPNRQLNILACNNCVMNGIETAFEVKDLAEFMIGSQGLMLAAGWPYQKLISAVVEDPGAETEVIARKMLVACARNLLDFTLMDRSSEQSLCDLTKLRDDSNLVKAIRQLVVNLTEGLTFIPNEKSEKVVQFPAICDAVRLARLEAQAFWGEMFVDLYDFCERLMQRCSDVERVQVGMLQELAELGFVEVSAQKELLNTKMGKVAKGIVDSCGIVLAEIKEMVPESYYIGPELQYSHGLSIYFPWTRPEAPYFFEPMPQRRDFWLRTPFEAYQEYDFAIASNWACFLQEFFRATLRKVRRLDRKLKVTSTLSLDQGILESSFIPQDQMFAFDLQKSSSDTGNSDHEACCAIKNYPRRNYLSPSDCERKIERAAVFTKEIDEDFKDPNQPPVSYLGWNVNGLLAEVLKSPSDLIAPLGQEGTPVDRGVVAAHAAR